MFCEAANPCPLRPVKDMSRVVEPSRSVPYSYPGPYTESHGWLESMELLESTELLESLQGRKACESMGFVGSDALERRFPIRGGDFAGAISKPASSKPAS